MSFSLKSTLRILIFPLGKSVWFSRKEMSISIFNSKKSYSLPMKRSVSQVTKVPRKKENTLMTTMIFHIKIHTFTYHGITVDGLFHYSEFYTCSIYWRRLRPLNRPNSRESPPKPPILLSWYRMRFLRRFYPPGEARRQQSPATPSAFPRPQQR